MDKVEYQQKLEELTALVDARDYAGALPIVESIDWRRVKSVKTLTMVADVYEANKNIEKTKDILTIAHTRTSIGRGVLSRLVEVCLQLGQVEQAEKYFREFSKVAQNDNSRYVLQYQLYKAKQAPLDAQIAVLEEYREKEYTERWAYELAELYEKAGEQEKCIEACDDLILWFSEGKYVLKAMELKRNYRPLSETQQVLYTRERDAENERARQAAAKAAEEAAAKEKAEREAAEAKARAEEEARRQAEETAKAMEETAEDHFSSMEETSGTIAGAEEIKAEAGASLPETAADADITTVFPAPTPADYEVPLEIPKESAPTAEPLSVENPVQATDVSAEVPQEDLKSRLLRTFHTVFGGTNKEEEEFPEDPDEQKPEPLPEPEEPAESELKVRELVPDEATYKDVSSLPASDAVPVYEEKEKVEFDLDNFLHETAGNFSEELSDGAYKATIEEEPVRLDEEINSAEEEAVIEEPAEGLTGTGPLTPVTIEETELEEESAEDIVEESPAEEAVAEEEKAVESEKKESAETEPVKEKTETEEPAQEPAPKKRTPHYIEELEIPDEEPTAEEKKSHTIPFDTIGQNTVPISIDKILEEETPEEQRIRILNKARPTRMSEEQRKIFTYFARIPGMDSQILEAVSGVYEHAGERTSLHGNIGVMGAKGTGKSRLSEGLVVTMCKDLDLSAAKIARIKAEDLNTKDPAKVASIMNGGFLMIEDVSQLQEDTLEKLNQAMEFRTDCMVVIIEDEKSAMRAFLKNNPVFAAKFDKLISIPVFTNDELVTFARTYAAENDCQLDDLGILALYTKIGNMQSEEKPVTISEVRDLVDAAMDKATKGRRRGKRGGGRKGETSRMLILHEKDFE